MSSYNYRNYYFPKDWIEYRLNQVVELCERPIGMKDDEIYDLVTVRRNFGGVDSRGEFYGKDILVKSQFKLQVGDFLISKRQIAHGACGIVPEDLNGAIVSNEYNVLLPKENLDINFFNYYVRLPFMKKYFFTMSDGVHIEKLLFKPQSWLKQKVTFPKKEEQTQIANILSTWDKAIELKEKLIQQKKEQKRGLMNKLLTGEIRLPGFEREWKEIRLGDISKIVTGTTPSTKVSDYYGGDFPWITPTDINDKKNISTSERTLTELGINKGRFVPKGSLLITCIASIGKNAILDVDGSCNQQINAILPSCDHSNNFLYYLISYKTELLKIYAGKSATPILNKETLSNIIFSVPCLEEQEAIANILSTVDKSINLSQKELELIKLQKRGLMQLLLTGIVRTVNN